MERVAFLVEDTDQRISCLLNPASLVFTRHAGLIPRRSHAGRLTRLGASDEPMLFTGGGRTEAVLDLLFDVDVAGSSIEAEDVRTLTRPLWNLTENSVQPQGYGRPSLVRLVWGKAWNVPGVVVAVAERLERFDAGGVPRRSWLRMRFLRISETEERTPPPPVPTLEEAKARTAAAEIAEVAAEVRGEGRSADRPFDLGERIDELAHRYFGNPRAWRLIAAFNDLDDPMRVLAGKVLRIPSPRFGDEG